MTAIIFIIILSILVFIHELGHFLTAKRAGMKVEEFGFGFPPRLWGIKKGETIYSINWIPFGGFVKILGENGEDSENPRSFSAGKARTRAGVIVAGVVMNILLAVVLLSIVNAAGIRIGLDDNPSAADKATDVRIQVVEVVPGSPADKAGWKPLDQIYGFLNDGKIVDFNAVSDVQKYIDDHKGQEITVVLHRGSQEQDSKIIPRANPPADEGPLGIALATTGVLKYPWYQAFWQGVQNTAIIFVNTLYGFYFVLKNFLTTGRAGAELSGPVGIAVITGQAAKLGLIYLLQFMSLISINLAVLNIIPFPALDGGRLLFIGIEKIRRKPVSKRVEATINALGFALLIVLMIYITTRDVLKFF